MVFLFFLFHKIFNFVLKTYILFQLLLLFLQYLSCNQLALSCSGNSQMIDIFPDHLFGPRDTLSGGEFTEIQGLGGRHKLDAQNPICIIYYLLVFDSCVHSHRNKILLIRRSRNGHDRGGSGQSYTQGRIGHAVETSFRKHAHHGDRSSDHIHREGDRCSLEVSAGQRQL